jgi:hypothetical protein
MLKARKYHPGDEIQINNLYKSITKRDRNIIEYSWQWLENPYKINSIWIIEEESGRIVGHHGLIPTPMYILNRSILAGKTENTMIHNDYKGKHIYFPFEKNFYDEAIKIYQILFTTSGEGAPGRIREKLGYKILSHWNIFCFYKINYRPNASNKKNIVTESFIDIIFFIF